jgi:hypothetical protein
MYNLSYSLWFCVLLSVFRIHIAFTFPVLYIKDLFEVCNAFTECINVNNVKLTSLYSCCAIQSSVMLLAYQK